MSDTSWPQLNTISLVGSFVPRRCGIATFTADLAEGLARAAPKITTRTVALNDRPEGYRYGSRVWFEVSEQRLPDYRLAADYLNMSHADVVLLQHEFGIFGGEVGAYILEFIKRLRMPVITTMHTILKDPAPPYREVTGKLIDASDRVVVMADRAMDFLRDIYNAPEDKIKLIPHGIPDVPFVDPNYFKDKFGVEGKKVILTFGLLGPSKGIENMVAALPRVVARHPDAVYIVLGATHPGVLAHAGEEYRLGLQKQARELGVQDHILWFDKFVELDELTEFLGAADVYVTPYNNEAQITSGTLAYALGTGKATVSTPYWHAQEMLADNRGILVPFHDPEAMGDAVIKLFDHEVIRHSIRKNAYQYTRSMRWSEVAGQYLDLARDCVVQRQRNPKPVAARKLQQKHELAEIKLDHLLSLTDSCGIISHAKATVPDRRSGYSTDLTANALVAVLLASDHLALDSPHDVELTVGRYLSFLDHAFDPDTARFRSHMSFSREWDAPSLSEDTQGRAIRGLGETVARSATPGHVTLAADLLRRALPACEAFQHAHGLSYALIGIHAYLRRFSGDTNARRIRETLATRLFTMFKDNASPDWPWPTDQVTYTAARLPHALLLSGRWMFRNDMIQTALASLNWLNAIQSGEDKRFAPVGSEGWYPRGGEKARFDQLPTEAAGAIDANLEAFRVTNEEHYRHRARRCLNWFLGDNDLRLPLYDNSTGGCCDRLTPQGVAEDQGAESTCAWLMSLLALYEHKLSEETESPIPREAELPTLRTRTATPAS